MTGTNTWIVGRDPCWIIDPGPPHAAHLDAIVTEATRRGGAAGIALTHDHGDHAEGTASVRAALGGTAVIVGAVRYPADARLAPGDRFGPLEVIATPGHAVDHVAFAFGDAIFTGDAVLGTGTAFITPTPGALADYLAALRALRDRGPATLHPGHGPLITDPRAKLDEYLAHRAAREEQLVGGLAAGARTIDAMLDAAWSEVPAMLRPIAEATLAAHLDKLDEEGKLPAGVARPDLPWL